MHTSKLSYFGTLQTSRQQKLTDETVAPFAKTTCKGPPCFRILIILLGVLLHFRMSPIAVMADIKATFHQVRVELGDWHSLRVTGGDCAFIRRYFIAQCLRVFVEEISYLSDPDIDLALLKNLC